MEHVDYAIIGAGIAGITLRHFLKNDRTVWLEPEPGRYKIGESIIPEQFRHPEFQALLPRMREAPSYSPKYGTTFVEGGSVATFPLPKSGTGGAMHIARTEMEQVMLDAWQITPRAERVVAVDLPNRRLRTDAGEYEVARQIIDCSGPSMVLSSLLGQTKKLWPVYSTWAYWDIEQNEPSRFHQAIKDKGWNALTYSYGQRLVLEEDPAWAPGRSTIISKIADGVWTWQIPLYHEHLLSYGVVSRHGHVPREQYEELARSHASPNYTLRMRPLDGRGAYNRLHVRDNFARTADVAATDRTILISDAFCFADPVYSVGTGLAVNKAIEVATTLNETDWTPAICETYCERYAKLLKTAVARFEFWYAGKLLKEDAVAAAVQEDCLVGNVFQSNIIWHFLQSIADADLPARLYDADPFTVDWTDPGIERATRQVTAAARVLLGSRDAEGFDGFHLGSARPARDGVVMKWTRDGAPARLLLVSHVHAGSQYYRQLDELGLTYLSNDADEGGDGAASLIDDLLPTVAERAADWAELVNRVGRPA